ncbi:hypothetical protein [Pseudolabrys sp.]|uniref:hypothetical protein n=1 Tax=Pseudolabrys sp. TaxID=1960880 RepID=UPI003D0DF51D
MKIPEVKEEIRANGLTNISFMNIEDIDRPVFVDDSNTAFPIGWTKEEVAHWRVLMDLPPSPSNTTLEVEASSVNAPLNKFMQRYARKRRAQRSKENLRQYLRWLVHLD